MIIIDKQLTHDLTLLVLDDKVSDKTPENIVKAYYEILPEIEKAVKDYESTVSSKRVDIRDNYPISPDHGISGRMCIQLPLTLPPLGFAEGFVVFPFGPLYRDNTVSCEVTARTSRKNFTTKGVIDRA